MKVIADIDDVLFPTAEYWFYKIIKDKLFIKEDELKKSLLQFPKLIGLVNFRMDYYLNKLFNLDKEKDKDNFEKFMSFYVDDEDFYNNLNPLMIFPDNIIKSDITFLSHSVNGKNTKIYKSKVNKMKKVYDLDNNKNYNLIITENREDKKDLVYEKLYDWDILLEDNPDNIKEIIQSTEDKMKSLKGNITKKRELFVVWYGYNDLLNFDKEFLGTLERNNIEIKWLFTNKHLSESEEIFIFDRYGMISFLNSYKENSNFRYE